MSERTSPLVRRRRLGFELRRLREQANHTIDGAANHLECSTAKVSRIETGRVSVRVQDVRDLLDLYEVTGERRDGLVDLARQSRQRAWWSSYSDLFALNEGFETLVALEEVAATIHGVRTNLVPGLLQTYAYAYHVVARATDPAASDRPSAEIERAMELRMTRRELLTRPDPPHLWSVLDEAVLRRSVGGPEVMREQVAHLREMGRRPNITLQVLPFDAGVYPSMEIPFTVLGFANPGDPKVAYVEAFHRTEIVERSQDVGEYSAAFEYARSVALSEEASAQWFDALFEG